MVTSQRNLGRLQVALNANAAAYRRSVQASVPGDCWDWVILTAANEKQAQGYRQELALRQRGVGPTGAFFPAVQRTLVVADPPGRRPGSGGATLGVLRALASESHLSPQDIGNHRVLLIHSGGASQRLPAYSPVGKIFAPLPLLRPDGQIATLFDHLYLTLAGLPERLGPGMLIVAGDVFLLFDHRHVQTPGPGVTALTMRVGADLGHGHGVFVTDVKHRIVQTLQKVSVATMQAHGACDAQGKVLIDTGLLFFDAVHTGLLAKLASAGIDRRCRPPLDLYDDITAALASATTARQYLAEPATRPMRRELWKKLHAVPFSAAELEGQFLHLGTTRQFRDAMTGHNPSPAAELFQHNVLAHSQWRLDAGRRVYHSVLLADGQPGVLGAGSLVEHSILRAPGQVGAGSIVSQVFAEHSRVELGENLLLFQAPLRDARQQLRFAQVLCGVEDDFKGRFADGKCLYLNQPIEVWLKRHGVTAEDIWRGVAANHRTLWTAKLFIATTTRDAVDSAFKLGTSTSGKADVARWKKAFRVSMADILETSDPGALIEHREVVAAYLQATAMLDIIRRRQDTPVEAVISHYSTAAAYAATECLLQQGTTGPAGDANVAIDQARALWCGVQLLQRPDHPRATARHDIEPLMRGAFAKVAQASEIGYRTIAVQDDAPGKIIVGREITATAPVRLDLSGGWSDTPPYCFECGGHVINVAIDLESRPAIGAHVKVLRQPLLILESADLGQRVELSAAQWQAAMQAPADVRDPFALHKQAIGIALPGLLHRHHTCGLHVLTEAHVPKGSGLGTSSILAGTLLAALHAAVRRTVGTDQLVEQTLLLEQRLSTGGGWQDQIGGIIGGVKSTVTAAGVPQRPVIESLALSDTQYAALEDRLVVYYSGQQRLARDILRRVMGRWLAREPVAVRLTTQLKQSAAALRTALLQSRWSSVAREITRYWQIKTELYPGSTTPTIDVLLMEMAPHYQAAGLAGAGGGGFVYFFCGDARQAKKLRAALAEHSSRPGSMGTVYETRINRVGLQVKVGKCQ